MSWITGLGEFNQLASEWDQALAAHGTPFDLHGWYRAWWAAFGAGGALAICVVRRDGALVAALPAATRHGRLEGLANDHTGLFRALAVDEPALSALARAAVDRGVAELALPMVAADDPALAVLRDAAGEGGMLSFTEPGPVSPLVATGGDFDAWRKGDKAKWKARIARYRRKIEREHDAVFELIVPPEQIERELDDGFRLEASGWKGEAGTAIDSRPETAAFYRDVAALFHARGELRLSRLVVDGELIAFGLCLLHGNRLYSLKTGYDERWRTLVPGLVLQLAIVERCFELGLDRYELLGNTADWKRKLATGERGHRTMRLYSKGPRGLAGYGYRRRLRPLLAAASHRLRPARA